MGKGEDILSVGGSKGKVVRTDEVGCPDDIHEFGREIHEYAVDRVEVRQVLLPELPPLLLSHCRPDGFEAVAGALEEDEGQILIVVVDVELLGVALDKLPVLGEQT